MWNSCAFRQHVSTAVFDDCRLILLGLGESLEGVMGLLAVSLQHSLLHVLALLLSPLFLCCLHLLSDFSVLFFCTLVLLQCLCISVVSVAASGRTDPELRL